MTELMDLSQLPLFKDVDVIQIGARNMQNFDLLKQLGKTPSPSCSSGDCPPPLRSGS